MSKRWPTKPPAAILRARRLAFLRITHHLATRRVAQFIVATHSPMLPCLHGARVRAPDEGAIAPTSAKLTGQHLLTRRRSNETDANFLHRYVNLDDCADGTVELCVAADKRCEDRCGDRGAFAAGRQCYVAHEIQGSMSAA